MLQMNANANSALGGTGSFDGDEMFDLAPVSLWLEDYSALKRMFDALRAQGVVSLRSYLAGAPERIAACTACLRVIKVNRKTLSLFEATDLDHLVANMDKIFHDDMRETLAEELMQLWEGRLEFFSNTVNSTLSGRRLDIQLSAAVLPGYEESWERILIAIEDVTERENARRKLAASDNYAKGLFEHSPVSLWVEDFSGVKRLLDDVRTRGISDFRVFTDVHPEFVDQCMAEIHVLDVNQHTLGLFGAAAKPVLLKRLNEVFRDKMYNHFREQLIDLWNGKLFQQREVVNYSLDGTELHLHLQFSVLPGNEESWSLVQVALTDITARKRAEAYLEYLGKHDPLTKLHNRTFYNDEINRLDRKRTIPVTVIMADLNGLKEANDALGHAAGDGLLSRTGEVLQKAVDKPFAVARIGGDEFVVLMPNAEEAEGLAMVETIESLIELNNQFHAEPKLSLSMGVATTGSGERLEDTVRRADVRLYEAKRRYYSKSGRNRRGVR